MLKPIYSVREVLFCYAPGCGFGSADSQEAHAHLMKTGHELTKHLVRYTLHQCTEPGCTMAGATPEATEAMHKKNGGHEKRED